MPPGRFGFTGSISRYGRRSTFTKVNLGANVNSAYVDATAWYFENEEGAAPLLFFVSTRPGGAGLSDIYVSQLQPDGLFGPRLFPNLAARHFSKYDRRCASIDSK
jgi:hypothetical protein